MLPGIPYLTDEGLVELYEALRSLGGAPGRRRRRSSGRASSAGLRRQSLGGRGPQLRPGLAPGLQPGPGLGHLLQGRQRRILQSIAKLVPARGHLVHHGHGDRGAALLAGPRRGPQGPGPGLHDQRLQGRDPGRRRPGGGDALRHAAGGQSCRWLRAYCTKLERVVRQGECEGCDVLPSIEERLR